MAGTIIGRTIEGGTICDCGGDTPYINCGSGCQCCNVRQSNRGYRGYDGSNDVWSNHPGFIGCWKGKRRCEADRVASTDASIRGQYPFSKNDDCETLQDTMTAIDRAIDKKAVDTSGGRGARRVRKRTINSLEKRRIDVRTAYEDNDCTKQQLAEQEQQFDLRIADMMGQYQKRSVEREGRENMTAYVAMGVGVLVIGGVFLLALRK